MQIIFHSINNYNTVKQHLIKIILYYFNIYCNAYREIGCTYFVR